MNRVLLAAAFATAMPMVSCRPPGMAQKSEAITVAESPQAADPGPNPTAMAGEPRGRVDVNDVSILFPPPTSATDAGTLIPIRDLMSADQKAIFPEPDFKQMVAAAESQASAVGNRRIQLRQPIKDFAVWRIAGIRVDPVAVGASSAVAGVFGQSPQIRLIIQPVTTNGQGVVIHDVALHLIYSFAASRDEAPQGVIAKTHPDEAAVHRILADVLKLKQFCAAAGVNTDGMLGVHPGLKAAVPGLTNEIRAFLQRHLHAERLRAGAVMGLNAGGPEPWIFVSMLRLTPTTFGPFPNPGLGPVQDNNTAQMISFIDSPNVLPAPSTTNRGAAAKANDLRLPLPLRRGVSTSILFDADPRLEGAATIGVDEQGKAVADPEMKNRDIADYIANPERCHFFNTDCASCHSETTRRTILTLPRSSFAYQRPEGVSGLDPAVSPSKRYNVRNFGWFSADATITQRTANETAEVAAFINSKLQ